MKTEGMAISVETSASKHFCLEKIRSVVHDAADIACGRSPTEIVGSNPTGGMDICLL